jgi:hypothetical protein
MNFLYTAHIPYVLLFLLFTLVLVFLSAKRES